MGKSIKLVSDLSEFIELAISKDKKAIEHQLLNICQEVEQELTKEEYLKIKEYPNSKRMIETLDKYEAELDLFMGMLYATTYLADDICTDSIISCYERLLFAPVNEEDGYGYIWRQLNNYPALLSLYGIGIPAIYSKNFQLLNKLFMSPTKDSYFDGTFVQNRKVYSIEKINCYHLFNFIEGLSVHWSDYFPNSAEYKSRSQNLYINNRIFDFYNNINQDVNFPYYQEQFDIFEYLVGLVIMDIRLQKENSIKFAPFGRNYLKSIFEEKLRTSIERFLNQNESQMLSANFFGGEPSRYKSAREEYRIFLNEVAKNS